MVRVRSVGQTAASITESTFKEKSMDVAFIAGVMVVNMMWNGAKIR
jgi:hypothetical protein